MVGHDRFPLIVSYRLTSNVFGEGEVALDPLRSPPWASASSRSCADASGRRPRSLRLLSEHAPYAMHVCLGVGHALGGGTSSVTSRTSALRAAR